MPNPNPKQAPGTKIKKGEVRNPLGAGAHNKDLKAVKKLTQQEIADVGALILNQSISELQIIRDDPTSSTFKCWVCSVALKAVKNGDAVSLNVLLDRILGKVKDVSEIVQTVLSANATKEQLQNAFKDSEAKY